MSLPTLSVRVAFGNNPFDSSLTWTEIGPASGAGPGGKGWARKITTKRGRERLLRTQAAFQAGTAKVALDNRDRRFDPTNHSSPYYPNVQPEKCLQVGATWNGTYYPIWTGYVDDWPQAWPGFAEAESEVAATDLFKAFALMRVLSSGYSKQVLADGATAYWTLGDTIGSTVIADSGPNNYQGVPQSLTLGTAGPLLADPTTAATFGSASTPTGSVSLPAASGLTGTAYSIEVWVNSSDPTLWNNGTAIFWTQNDNSQFGFTSLSAANGPGGTPAGILRFTAQDDSGNAVQVQTTSQLPADGKWHHIVATRNGTTVALYVDGVAQSLTTLSSAVTAAITPTWCGIGSFGHNNGPSLIGSIGQVALYATTVLSAAQVTNHYNLAAFRAQYTGQLLQQVLSWLGFPASRQNVDTGQTFCQQDNQQEFSTKVLDFLQKIEQTEQGQLYVAANGNLVFHDRYHRYAYPNATSQATIGDGGAAYPSEIPYAMGGVTLNFDRAELFNDLTVTRRGGNTQEAINSTSVTQFTNRSAPGLSDLLMATDADALGCAQWIVADTAYPQFRVGQLVIDPRVDDRWWPIVLGLDIGQVITINKHNIPGGGSVSLPCRIEGIEHQIEPPRGWTTTMHVSLVGTNPWLLLNDPVCGFFDQGNRLGW